MRWLVLLLLLVTCAAPVTTTSQPVAMASPTVLTPTPPLVATRDPQFTPRPLPTFSAPTANASERQSASNTRLYLTAFQSGNVSEIDPISGHVLHEFSVTGDQAGMAVAPDGTRLYIVDGMLDGQLRIFETATWQLVHRAPVADCAHLLGGNPIALSGDGRWLVVAHLNYTTRQGWSGVFDTQQMTFPPDDVLPVHNCHESWLPVQLVGRVGHNRVYANCDSFVMALDASTLKAIWRAEAPTMHLPTSVLVLAPDSKRMYGLYSHVAISYAGGYGKVTETDLRLRVWDATNGQLIQQLNMSERVKVPLHTFGRGEGGYLAIAPDGSRLYVAWEDRLWALTSDSLQVVGELQMPTPTDGLATSMDGRELYLLPSTAGDMKQREQGMWTVDATTLKIVRHATDWPAYTVPFFFAVPAAKP